MGYIYEYFFFLFLFSFSYFLNIFYLFNFFYLSDLTRLISVYLYCHFRYTTMATVQKKSLLFVFLQSRVVSSNELVLSKSSGSNFTRSEKMKNECANRESNPGPSRGRRRLYHLTIRALFFCGMCYVHQARLFFSNEHCK